MPEYTGARRAANRAAGPLSPLIQFLRQPDVVRDWAPGDWNRFLPLARDAGLLGRSLYLLQAHGLLAVAPPRLVDHLHGAVNQTRYVQGQARRELRHVARLMQREHIPLIALKGVAYLAAELPPSDWRSLCDIDLLVPKANIGRAEEVLRDGGWGPSGEFDAYDQSYYRDWMHEIPPLVHHSRQVEVDLHHNLAPPVSRIRIDAEYLWEHSVAVDDASELGVRTLAPADMLLHNAVHLFMNDELRGGLRDLVDFRDLFEHFCAADTDFPYLLHERAAHLGCTRALFYAACSARRLLGLRAPDTFFTALNADAPLAPVRRSMAWLIDQVLAPSRLGLRRTALAQWALFVRSHWVRMPPLMLFRHLARKAFRSNKSVVPVTDLPG